jgi:L(+)-tartrate dehydratase beta subunit
MKNKKIISTPIAVDELAGLKTGDIVYLNGMLVTGRDEVYERVVLEGQAPPLDLRGLALFHAGPIVRDAGKNSWEMVAVGPTTSMRMESCQGEFLELSGARLIVGKGGMGAKTAEACRRLGAIHTVFPGGCAVLAAAQVEAIEAVHWLELGMAEAMWVLRVKDFGPLIVSIDAAGNNIFQP